VSRWSSPYISLLALLLLLLPAGAAGAQAGAARTTAILLRGPVPLKGLPVYAANNLPASRGEYQVGDDTVVVFYSRQELLIPASWTPLRCPAGGLRLFQVQGYDTYSLGYSDERGFHLFFLFPAQDPPPYACSFIEAFLRRLLLLLGVAEDPASVPFPAVLELAY
jgi:hypothetical protein